jgi:hypothetical protein
MSHTKQTLYINNNLNLFSSSLPHQQLSKTNKPFLFKNRMSSRSRAWTWSVATSVGVVEALKDQGICRWNSVIRSAQQHAKHNMRSLSHANNKLSSSSCATKLKDEKSKQAEESLRTVMFLSCWGPN